MEHLRQHSLVRYIDGKKCNPGLFSAQNLPRTFTVDIISSLSFVLRGLAEIGQKHKTEELLQLTYVYDEVRCRISSALGDGCPRPQRWVVATLVQSYKVAALV